jgi:hypothetical protein
MLIQKSLSSACHVILELENGKAEIRVFLLSLSQTS